MSVRQVGTRDWDRFDGYLFDIDGTLLECTDAVHYFAFCEALASVAGHPMTLEGVTAHGNVDTGILRDAFRHAAVPDEAWRPRLPEIHAGMGRYVEAHRQELCTTVLPGARAMLEHLQSRGARLGVATGNLAAIGRLKLQHAGLLQYFTVQGWSDEFEWRADVFRNAVTLMQTAGSASALCVVGDTPSDVRAAKANGLPVIAVATGVYSREELLAEQPELCLSSLQELLDRPDADARL